MIYETNLIFNDTLKVSEIINIKNQTENSIVFVVDDILTGFAISEIYTYSKIYHVNYDQLEDLITNEECPLIAELQTAPKVVFCLNPLTSYELVEDLLYLCEEQSISSATMVSNSILENRIHQMTIGQHIIHYGESELLRISKKLENSQTNPSVSLTQDENLKCIFIISLDELQTNLIQNNGASSYYLSELELVQLKRNIEVTEVNDLVQTEHINIMAGNPQQIH